ncbi:unnamed protein product, partial [Ceratitis capitata]
LFQQHLEAMRSQYVFEVATALPTTTLSHISLNDTVSINQQNTANVNIYCKTTNVNNAISTQYNVYTLECNQLLSAPQLNQLYDSLRCDLYMSSSSSSSRRRHSCSKSTTILLDIRRHA